MIKRRNMVQLIMFSIITFGVYGIFFWWGYVNDINNACVCDGKKSPNFLIVILLSVITGGFYYWFWLYRQGERLKAVAPDYRLVFKDGGSIILLMYIFGTFCLNLGSVLLGSAYKYTVNSDDIVTIGTKIFNPGEMETLMRSIGITQDTIVLITFCSVVFFIIGVVLTLSSFNILIRNLNAISTVYNERCI